VIGSGGKLLRAYREPNGRKDSVRCRCRKSDPDVVVMQSAEDRQRKNAAGGLHGPG
jgi:hypothetical protein